jgi:hypothetical protein
MDKVFPTIGASNHFESDRQIEDFYATLPRATILLLENENFKKTILEPCVGQGHIASILKDHAYNVICQDIIDRGYSQTQVINFFDMTYNSNDIITNPPYGLATKFVQHALTISTNGCKIACLLKLTFLEGKTRKKLFMTHPPKYVYVFSSRIGCTKDGKFKVDKTTGELYVGSTIAYAWFVWEKGYTGNTIIKRIN